MKQELSILRVIMCLFIVTTHLLTQYTISTEPDDNQIRILFWIRNVIISATPGFIILSVLLTTMNYKHMLPKGYMLERIKYILIPYILIGIFYCYNISLNDSAVFFEQFKNVVLRGEWYGYFILVIMQFFILNKIIYKVAPDIFKSVWPMILALIINAVYLYAYYTVETVFNFVHDYYPFSEHTILLGWIGFYFFGAFIGAHYDKVTSILSEHIALTILALILSYGVFVLLHNGDFWTVSSFHYSLIPYHMTSFMFILYTATQLQKFNQPLVDMISRYSLFIFLFHPMIIQPIYNYTSAFVGATAVFLSVSLLYVLGTCIGIGEILRHFGIFKYLLGKRPYRL